VHGVSYENERIFLIWLGIFLDLDFLKVRDPVPDLTLTLFLLHLANFLKLDFFENLGSYPDWS
jgi:hypothetical protein